ncbi:MAG: plasmid mobilization protein [Paracoccus sp. (in: a-proteobacteria)]|uniref:plasmid mobilization protein n=1 Tax=Paracoccus sp. TaxID=267 RepID=UPI002E8D57F2|nr:hypothetical protein [Pseudomonadota bacterium]
MARAGDGRPRSAARQRTVVLRFRVSDEEHGRIRAAAAAGRHANTAAYLRACALHAGPRPVPAARLVGGLGLIAGRLAAITRLAERGGMAAIIAEANEAEAALAACLRDVMAEDAG